jgi:hypothetical protein
MIRRIAAIAAALLISAACSDADLKAIRPVEAAPVIEVRNDHALDVVVYVVSGGQSVRLGMVVAHAAATFSVPRGIITDQLRFFADPIGARSGYLSEAVSARRGDRVRFTIGQSLPMSFVSVGAA